MRTRHSLIRRLLGVFVSTTVLFGLVSAHSASAFPDPTQDVPLSKDAQLQTAVFAGGCFWGIEAVFRHVRGVTEAVSGYAGGAVKSPSYEQVSSGMTGHAESVRIAFDASRISYGQLLKIFFAIAHNPTELNRQGPDVGTQYRSAVFYTSEEQRRVAQAYIGELQAAHVFERPIVTEVAALRSFYAAESYHQNYLALHPDQPYIVINDLPKLARLKSQFLILYR
jgi:peptide-methionine (S)-S-oxide reductase